jgi:hypothetical protein
MVASRKNSVSMSDQHAAPSQDDCCSASPGKSKNLMAHVFSAYRDYTILIG